MTALPDATPAVDLLAEALHTQHISYGDAHRDGDELRAQRILAASPALRARLDGSSREAALAKFIEVETQAFHDYAHLTVGWGGCEDDRCAQARALLAGQPETDR